MSYISPTPYTPGKLISAASTNATSVTAVATLLGFLSMANLGSAPAYVKVYNKAGAPTVGTDTPVHTFMLPGNLNGAGSNLTVNGLKLSTGFAFAITGGMADSDATAVAANQVVVNYGTANA
jgi:hypothetical protein